MPQTQNYSDFQKLTFKDIEYLLISVSQTTAKQYLTDIKKTYDVKAVLFHHFKKYFKIT